MKHHNFLLISLNMAFIGTSPAFHCWSGVPSLVPKILRHPPVYRGISIMRGPVAALYSAPPKRRGGFLRGGSSLTERCVYLLLDRPGSCIPSTSHTRTASRSCATIDCTYRFPPFNAKAWRTAWETPANRPGRSRIHQPTGMGLHGLIP
jgi:hypothetical protein